MTRGLANHLLLGGPVTSAVDGLPKAPFTSAMDRCCSSHERPSARF